MIKCIVTGVDNFLVRKEAPLKDQNLSALKDKIQELRERRIKFSLVTGRSLESSADLLESLSVTDLCGFEMGLHLYNPLKGDSTDILDYRKMSDVKSAIELVRDNLLHNRRVIEDKFEEKINYLEDRTRIVTFETKDKTGFQLYQILRVMIPEYISRMIFKGDILMFPSAKAVDIMPNLTKGDAASDIAKIYGIDIENVLACGVSYHTDGQMFMKCGYAACSENSDNGCKGYIRNQKGDKGYISKLLFTEGAVDVLNKSIEW